MIKRIWRERAQTAGEELANSISHGVGLIGALAVTPILIVVASRSAGPKGIVAASIFAATMIVMYAMSTLYHALPAGSAKRVFRILDHSAIYLLIAGTYTPVTLILLGGGWGWSLFGVSWGLAAAGVTLKATRTLRHPVLSTVLYIAMGWVIIVAVKPLWTQVPFWGLVWIALGGVAYTTGVAFFAARGVRYAHLVWHIFVVAGTTCHFVAVLKYAT